MGLFFSKKKKKTAKDKNSPLKKNKPPKKKIDSKETKSYPNYDELTPEEAKLVLGKRIRSKLNDVSDIDVSNNLDQTKVLTKKDTPKKDTPKKETPKKETPKKDIPKVDLERRDTSNFSKKEELNTDEAIQKAEDRRKKKLEVSEGKLEKTLQQEKKKDLVFIEKAEIKTEEIRNKQKTHIEKLQKEAGKEEDKQKAREEKKLQKEVKKIAREKDKEQKKREKEEKKKNSFWTKYFERRSHRFAISDRRYRDLEKKQKEKELRTIEKKKEEEKAFKIKDHEDRKKYDEEILARRKAIVEREQIRARDMAKRREEKIAGTLSRRKKRGEERVLREKEYIKAVAQREAMLRNRAEKQLEKKNRKAYYKSLPKVERRAKKEAYNREYQKKRNDELKKIEQIKKANKGLPPKDRTLAPSRNLGSLWDRGVHVLRVLWKRTLMRPVKIKHRMINKWNMDLNRLVAMIDFLDRRSDRVNDVIVSIQSGFTWRYNRLRIFSDRNKEPLLGILAGTVIVTILVLSFVNFVTGYEYAYNNRTLGIVKDQEDVTLLVDIVNQQLSMEHEALIAIDKSQDITFNRVFIINKEVDDQEDVLRRLTYMRDLTAKGYGIYIDGVKAGILSKEEEADKVLNRILNNYLFQNENTEYESVTFAEKIEVKEIDTKLGRIENVDNVVERILTGGRRTDVHVVEAGETFAAVAEKHGISQVQLKESNPDVNVAQLEIGETLYLTEEVSMVKVQTVEVTTYIEYVPYITTYEDDSSIWEGETTTKIKGLQGEREVVAKIVRNNGKEVAKMILKEKSISEPKTELILVGTKPPPPLQGTGELVYPVSGFKLTSPFGMRWGRLHSGVDLAAPTGTKIRAADGGTILFAGYNGQLGYSIEIDHGGNRTTVYGHCSKLFVSSGDKVYQGQHIANVGNTGRSTGPHLHFEVRELGVAKNPLSYL